MHRQNLIPNPQPWKNWPTPAASRKPSPPVNPKRARLYCNPSESRSPAKIFSRRGAEAQRKQCMAFLVGLSLRLCASARDIPSARSWLRLAALRLIVPNQASIVLKRAKTRYFFSRPSHAMTPPLFLSHLSVRWKMDMLWPVQLNLSRDMVQAAARRCPCHPK
jgi:hypothetical protein